MPYQITKFAVRTRSNSRELYFLQNETNTSKTKQKSANMEIVTNFEAVKLG